MSDESMAANRKINPNVLIRSQIFSRLSAASQDMLAALAREAAFKKGESIFLQGDPGDALFAVSEGLVEICVIAASGKKLSLNLMKPGDVFGEIALLDSGVRTANATALEDSLLLRISRASVRDLMQANPPLSIELIEVLCHRLRWVNEQMVDQALLPFPMRLAKRLLILQAHMDESGSRLSISQSELASFAGASREATNKTLNVWRQKNWIEISRGAIKVLDHAALTGVAEALD